MHTKQGEMPCIRCGYCANVCPAQLLPQQLLLHIRGENFEHAERDGLFNCIECGDCDRVCPSHIPLLQQYRDSKQLILARQFEKQRAQAAQKRFETRHARLEREAAEHTEHNLVRKQQATSGEAVAAAIERAKTKRAAGRETLNQSSSQPLPEPIENHKMDSRLRQDNEPMLIQNPLNKNNS